MLSVIFAWRAGVDAQAAGNFVPTGSTALPRAFHQATLLRNGMVLVTGTGTPNAELYDPDAGKFIPTGGMAVGRTMHSATLLPDGRVLIVGGRDDKNQFLGTAEIYDPRLGAFIPAGQAINALYGHAATLLNSGKVLITGGANGRAYTISVPPAQLYDPATGRFTQMGDYAYRYVGDDDGLKGATATLLPNGKVLVAAEPVAELYDPGTGTFALTGRMMTSEPPHYIYGRTATLLPNGKVLVTGGEHEDLGRFDDAEIYDPATGEFTFTGKMAIPRDSHSATLLRDGSVLVAGGEFAQVVPGGQFFGGVTTSTEFYDPVAGKFSAGPEMRSGRSAHTATLLPDGRVLITGGFTSFSTPGTASSAELFVPEGWVAAPASAIVVTEQPVGQKVTAGGSVSLTVLAGASGTVHYQWRRNGAEIPGATNPSLSLTAATAANAGDYDVVVSNSGGAVTSRPAHVSVITPGTVVAWGLNNYGQTNVPAGLNDVTAIAAGEGHTVALKSDGTVVAWGRNDHGQTDVPVGLTGVTAIAAGYYHTIALKNDGTVVAWGWNEYGQTRVPAGLGGVTALAAGWGHTIALKGDGTVVVWGGETPWEFYPVTLTPSGLHGVVAIAATANYTLAARSDGFVDIWGDDGLGDPDTGTLPIRDAIAISRDTALRRDGTVVTWTVPTYGSPRDGPFVVLDLSDIVAVDSRIALRRDGTAVTWTWDFRNAAAPSGAVVQEAGLSGVSAIAGGGGHFAAIGPAILIAQHPASQAVTAGQGATFTVKATSTAPLSYQWLKDGISVPGATRESLTLTSVQAGQTGNYAVVVTNGYVSVTSNLAALRLNGDEPQPGRLTNFSVRATIGSRAPILIAGFAVGGAGTLPVLLRGVGPGLGALGISGALGDPGLTLLQGGTVLGANDNWESTTQVSAVSAAVGAFPLSAGSRDAVLYHSGLAGGSYTVQIAGKSTPAGFVLAEIYDATPLSATATARLVNVSARGRVDDGGNEVVAGFVVSGRGSTQLLIRGVGLALARFGVASALEDPVLRVYDHAGVLIAANDDWNGDPLLRDAFLAVHAFEPAAASKDAALLLRLQPGSYTAVLSRASGSGGEGLIEIYEIP